MKNGVLVGLIPAPDLEYALDNLPFEADDLCLMSAIDQAPESEGEEGQERNPCDFTPYIDPVWFLNLICGVYRKDDWKTDEGDYRLQWHWRDTHLWTWCTSAL